jgi:hypothetical protein
MMMKNQETIDVLNTRFLIDIENLSFSHNKNNILRKLKRKKKTTNTIIIMRRKNVLNIRFL